jgi:ceramide glucosyltransferase
MTDGSWAVVAGWLAVVALAVLTGIRFALARRVALPEPVPGPRVTVLQPILSGDPWLAKQLLANLANHPHARFRWLLDAADAEGRRIAGELAAAAVPGQVEVRLFDPAPAGVNPKVYKLARGVEADDELVAVLDDDTVLGADALERARGALGGADLVTGLPSYEPAGGWSGLVAGFVNANALLTYLPPLSFGPPVTINGMFNLTTPAALARAGGFGAIEHLACDDYELARAYRAAGLRLCQTSIPVRLRTRVPDAAAYLRLLRRWTVYAFRLLRDDHPPALVVLTVLPAALPPLALLLAAVGGSWLLAAAVPGVLLGKALALAALRRSRGEPRATGIGYQVAADLLQPLHAVAALAARGHITWRGRRLRLARDGSLAA